MSSLQYGTLRNLRTSWKSATGGFNTEVRAHHASMLHSPFSPVAATTFPARSYNSQLVVLLSLLTHVTLIQSGGTPGKLSTAPRRCQRRLLRAGVGMIGMPVGPSRDIISMKITAHSGASIASQKFCKSDNLTLRAQRRICSRDCSYSCVGGDVFLEKKIFTVTYLMLLLTHASHR